MTFLQWALLQILLDFERQHKRGVRLRALRKRDKWRKADIKRLVEIGVAPAAQRRMRRLIDRRSPGRGVVPRSRSLPEIIIDGFRLADPATPARTRRDLYKKTPWFPSMVEAAYRGELEKAKRERGDPASPHLKASDIAKERVADAAGLSAAKVHQICFQVRADRGEVLPDAPATSAEALRRHLEQGPDELADARAAVMSARQRRLMECRSPGRGVFPPSCTLPELIIGPDELADARAAVVSALQRRVK
jgi:hypothetical protein